LTRTDRTKKRAFHTVDLLTDLLDIRSVDLEPSTPRVFRIDG
jgi:hypothetical protein